MKFTNWLLILLAFVAVLAFVGGIPLIIADIQRTFGVNTPIAIGILIGLCLLELGILIILDTQYEQIKRHLRRHKLLLTFIGVAIGLLILAVLRPYIPPLGAPTPTPRVVLASVIVNSEVQPDGTVKEVVRLSLNSLGVGELLLSAPVEMNLEDSAIVRLTITPNSALAAPSTPIPTQVPAPPQHPVTSQPA